MTGMIDCMIIGQNQLPFEEYEEEVRRMGPHSGAYRDLDKNIIRYNNKLYNGTDIFNLFCSSSQGKGGIKPIKSVETFNAAIAYLGTYLHRQGLRFDYVNDFQGQKDELAWKLQQENLLTIAITTTLYVDVFPIVEIVKFIKMHNQTAKIIVGGPFISTKARYLNALELDYLLQSIGANFYVNSSQGETSLVNIIHAVKNHLPLAGIKNIYYKTKNRYISTPLEKENNQLKDNMVNWDLFGSGVGEFVNIRTGISCPFSCSFCGFPEHAGKYQVVPVEIVEKELNTLNKIGTVKSITFVDDTFNIPVKRFKEILKMMIKNKYRFRWNSFFRCQYVDRETVDLMKESGVESVFLGLESGNDRILKNMNKESNVDLYRRGMELLGDYGITTFGNFIVGFPGETEATAQDTLRFIKESSLDFYRAQLWYCEIITPIWRKREEYRIKGESFEWSHHTMNSNQACDIIEEMIMSIDQPTRLIQYYFDYDNVMQLTYKGVTLDQVKKFLKAFDKGVKEKVSNPSQTEVSFDVIKEIKYSCLDKDSIDSSSEKKDHAMKRLNAEFDF